MYTYFNINVFIYYNLYDPNFLFQLEVHEAKAIVDNHPQWDIPETEEEEDDQEDSDGIEESEEDDDND